MTKVWSTSNAYFLKAREMTRQGQHGPALELYRAAAMEQPGNALILAETAIAYGNYGFRTEAAEYFRKAAALDPELVNNYPEFQARLDRVAQEKDLDKVIKDALQAPDISQIDLLIQGLNVKSDFTRSGVVAALCELRDPRAIEPIFNISGKTNTITGRSRSSW